MNTDEALMSSDRYFKLYADCMLVKGARTSAIYDLTRRKIITFPSEYFAIVEGLLGKRLKDALSDVGPEGAEPVERVVRYLLDSEVAVLSAMPERFPAIKAGWDRPSTIQNAIIDVDSRSHDFAQCFDELDRLGCEYVQVRAFSNLLTLSDLDALAEAACHKSIRSLEMLIRHSAGITNEQFADLIRTRLIISKLVVHSSPRNEVVQVDITSDREGGPLTSRKMYFITDDIASSDACGRISRTTIRAPTVPLFHEMKNHNGCLNRKISIDVNGEIKSCPSFGVSYGNIARDRLTGVVDAPDFRALWDVSKDQIETCRDCELRYACTDCRAFTRDPDDPYSKPLKCGYDPYSGIWDEAADRPARTPQFVRLPYPVVT